MQADDILADLMDGLRAQLPGADDPLIFYTLRNTTRDLCRIGRVWKVMGTIPALRNIGALRVSNIAGFGEPVWIEGVSFRDRNLTHRPVDFCLDKPEGGLPHSWAFEAPDRIYLKPILQDARIDDAFCVHAVLQPRMGEDPALALAHMPAHILSFASDTLTEATLGRMMVMPSKPWSNIALGGGYLRSAHSKMAKARIQSNDARGNDYSLRWRFPNPAAWRRP